jgi:hypothetical protein
MTIFNTDNLILIEASKLITYVVYKFIVIIIEYLNLISA